MDGSYRRVYDLLPSKQIYDEAQQDSGPKRDAEIAALYKQSK